MENKKNGQLILGIITHMRGYALISRIRWKEVEITSPPPTRYFQETPRMPASTLDWASGLELAKARA